MRIRNISKKNKSFNARGQTWSIELIATIMIFLFALVIFGGLVLKKDNNVGNLRSDAEKTMNVLSSDSVNSIIYGNSVNKLMASTLNYTQLKSELGLKNGVCIYFEDKNGRIITINGTVTAVGDSSIMVNGVPCVNNTG